MRKTMYRLLCCAAIIFYSSVNGRLINWDYNPSTEDTITPKLVSALVKDLSMGTLVFNTLNNTQLLEAFQEYIKSQIAIKLTTNLNGHDTENDKAILDKIRATFMSHVYQIIWELLLLNPEDATLRTALEQARIDHDPNAEEAASKMLESRINNIKNPALAQAFLAELGNNASSKKHNQRLHLCMLSHLILLIERASLTTFLCGKETSIELLRKHMDLCSLLFPECLRQYSTAIDVYYDLAEYYVSVTEHTFEKLSTIRFNHIQDLIFVLFSQVKLDDLASLTSRCEECAFFAPSSSINYDIYYSKGLCIFCKDAEPRKNIADVDKPTIPPMLWGTMYS